MNLSKFTTTDLALATFLITNGCKTEPVRKGQRRNGHPIGAWTFVDDSALKSLVEKFHGPEGKMLKDFHESMNKTREDMFKFLGIGKK